MSSPARRPLRAVFSLLGRAVGYDRRNWLRIRQMESWDTFLRKLGTGLRILEISPGWNQHWKRIPGSTYRSVGYPEFDISRQTLPDKFDVVIADQVLEHVPDVDSAVANIREMVAPGGHALIATPFLFRVHGRPNDFRRWTEAGLRHLLLSNGFTEEHLQTFSWGNKACAKAHIGGPVRSYGFGKDLSNDPDYPLMVWAIAGKAASS